MDIIGGLAAVSQALDIAKKLRDFEKQFNNAEFKLELAELYSKLADTKIALSDAKQLLQDRDEEIKLLKQNKEERVKTISYRGFNFGLDQSGRPIGRAFCPVCEKKGEQIQLTRLKGRAEQCPSCDAKYDGHPTYLPEVEWMAARNSQD